MSGITVVISEQTEFIKGKAVACTCLTFSIAKTTPEISSAKITPEISSRLYAMLSELAFNAKQTAALRSTADLSSAVDLITKTVYGKAMIILPCTFSAAQRLQLERLLTYEPYNFTITEAGTLTASSSRSSISTGTDTSPVKRRTSISKSVSFAELPLSSAGSKAQSHSLKQGQPRKTPGSN